MAFRGSSGTYNVRASEMARKRRDKAIPCIVFLLDDSQFTLDVDKYAKGQVLLDCVYQHLELVEKDYFGLQIPGDSPVLDPMRWLDPIKPIRKQLKIGPPYLLYFRVKFYVSDPSKLQEEFTRYNFFLQVKRDILEGRLFVPQATAVLLASYAVQSELGDFNSDEHRHGYLSDYQLMPGQAEESERKIAELHKLHKGQTPADAEYNYLDHAKRLDMYGVIAYQARVRDSTAAEIQLGVTSGGLVVFQNIVRINSFSWAKIVKISFKRKQFFIQLRRQPGNSYDNLLGFNMLSYRSCKNLWKSCVEHHSFFRLQSPRPPLRRFLFFFTLGSKFRYSGRTEHQTVEEGKRKGRNDRNFLRSPSRRLLRQTIPTVVEPTKEQKRGPTPVRQVAKVNGTSVSSQASPMVRPFDSISHKIQVSENESHKPRKAWGDSPTSLECHPMLSPSLLPSKDIEYMDDEPSSEEIYDIPPSFAMELSGKGVRPYRPVTVKILADENGRFGFNVKGGADQGMPILVSRVAPGTPAATCSPKLMEGDEVFCINESDIRSMTHEQVIKLIRAAGDSRSRELRLLIYPTTLYGDRRDLYGGPSPAKEPDFLYIPAFPQKLGPYCDELVASMLMLAENMETGALELQYGKVERRMSNLTCDISERPENRICNRYSDVLPYDSTRVVLTSSQNGDYINANFINIEIPTLENVNRYIATQGPLFRTAVDFWQMVWEQSVSLILMLTQLKEGNHPKCFQYWPDSFTTGVFGRFKITFTREALDKETSTFMIREFIIYNTECNESRKVTHIQYLNWPDYGVPSDPSDFIRFVVQVCKEKLGMVEPVVIHCSAGVGRTGVFMLVDTALCLIEANEPVYPQEILLNMRRWRALLVQNYQQYRFACQIILRCFNDESILPTQGSKSQES